MIKNNDYWKKREIAEKEWQKQAEKDLQSYNQHIAQMYQSTIDDIDRQIRSDLSIANGKLVTAKGMQEYETLAKDAVKKANLLRQSGHHVTRKDFSKEVNDRLKIYNATMRINRNEMLKSKIGARLVDLGVEQEADLTKKLWNDYIKEKERQAGILGVTTKTDLWTSKEVQEQIAKQIGGANFSKRIWADIDGLKGQLDGLISSAIIRGENPKAMAKWLTGMVSATIGNQRYVAERLARTETARVQFEAQKKSIIDNGYKYVKWIAEGSACKVCREIADKDNGYDEYGVYKAKDVPDIPVHPNCMCSISAYWVENPKNTNINSKSEIDNEFLDLNDPSEDTITQLANRFNTVVETYKDKTGIDIRKSIKDDSFSDKEHPYTDQKSKFIKFLVHRYGYDTKPQKVKEFSAHPEINKIVLDPKTKNIESQPTFFYRGIKPTKNKTVEQIEKDLFEGEYVPSGAKSSDYGRGIYITAFKPTADRYARNGGKVLELGLDNKAKILNANKAKIFANVIAPVNALGTDENYDIISLLAGYDAVRSKSNSVEFVVINRGILQWH